MAAHPIALQEALHTANIHTTLGLPRSTTTKMGVLVGKHDLNVKMGETTRATFPQRRNRGIL